MNSGAFPRTFPPDHCVLNTPVLRGPGAKGGYCHAVFRRRVEASAAIGGRVWLTASQRFLLYVDGSLRARGPSRGTPGAWHVTSLPLRLEAGIHNLEVRVVHFGEAGGKGQLGGSLFFLMTAEEANLRELVATGEAWTCREDFSRTPCFERGGGTRGHTAVGAGECLDTRTPIEEERPAPVWRSSVGNRWGNLNIGHHLVPDPLPPLADSGLTTPFVVRGSRRMVPDEAIRVEAGGEWSGWFDAGEQVNGYVSLAWRGGCGAALELVSCEAARDPETGLKGDRDEVEGKRPEGQTDRAVGDGGDHVFEPVWFRSFRYLHLTVRAAEEAVEVQPPRYRPTGYPLEPTPEVRERVNRLAEGAQKRMFDISLRTARLCSHETLFDCPQYEQAQFPGDARVLAWFFYRVCDEDLLIRKAINDLHASRQPHGLLFSHYPSSFQQVLPTYSLQWIGMLYDFLTERGDAAFLRRYLCAAREILEVFADLRRGDGLPGRIPWPPFTDWTKGFDAGRAPEDADGGSSIVAALLAQACGWMAALEAETGYPELVPRWEAMREDLNAAVRRECLDRESGCVRDTPAQNRLSVHAQVQAGLAGALSPVELARALDRTWREDDVVQPGTFYYLSFVWQAFRLCGWEDRVEELLEPFRALMTGTGLTTWPERNHPESRSDCHGWSILPALILCQPESTKPSASRNG